MSTNVEAAIQRRLLDPAFLQKLIRYGLWLLIGAIAVISVQGIAILALVLHPAHVKYIYHDSFGQPRELIVTDQPVFTPSEVSNWAVRKVTNLYTLDFAHVRRQLDAAGADFTVPAWNSWVTGFLGRGNIDWIEKNRVFVTATPKEAARIESQGVNAAGRYEWRIQFPMYVRWANLSGEKTDAMSVIVVIERTNDPAHADGLVITQLNVPKTGDVNQ